MKAFTIFGGLWGQNQFLLQISETTFSKQISLIFFCNVHSKMFRNMYKLRQKVRNGQNLPQESPNFRNYFFLSNFMDNLVRFFTSLPKQREISIFSLQNGVYQFNEIILLVSLNCCWDTWLVFNISSILADYWPISATYVRIYINMYFLLERII